ncbi:hypothetical protein CYMTET_18901 [Cymbomonas tetramitiformis]|uniref:Uncharacterized protein n=1 Tax=Cymbomonas tetramitiformis TaxID=36881 RepID=A0AAE0L5F1_9CHLO|nr:hypothetical protein CYMTET_18901 [Cymbomonas tetramitiformis]
MAKPERRITKAMLKFRLVAPIRAELVRRGLWPQGLLKSEIADCVMHDFVPQARLEQAFRVEFSSADDQKASTRVNIEGDGDEDEDDTGNHENESGSSGPESFSGNADSPQTRSIRDLPCSTPEIDEGTTAHRGSESSLCSCGMEFRVTTQETSDPSDLELSAD